MNFNFIPHSHWPVASCLACDVQGDTATMMWAKGDRDRDRDCDCDRDWTGDHNCAQALAPSERAGRSVTRLEPTSGDRRCHRVAARAAFGWALHVTSPVIKTSPFRETATCFVFSVCSAVLMVTHPPYRIRLPPAFLCHQQTRMRCALNA